MTDEPANTVNYPPPVDQLLSLEPISGSGKNWLDYRQFGFTEEHVPDLIRMSVDPALHLADSDSSEVWAPLHAWRALAQLGATEAVRPLLELLDDQSGDDWIHEDLPLVFTMIGSAILPELIEFLHDAERDLLGRIAVASALKDIALAETDRREEVVAALSQALSKWRENEKEVNAFLIGYLADLEAVEAAPLMEEAFLGEQVDISIFGDWEDIQIRLGLLSERKTPRPDYNPGLRHAMAALLHKAEAAQAAKEALKAKKAHEKRKREAANKARKTAKAARQQNRHRK